MGTTSTERLIRRVRHFLSHPARAKLRQYRRASAEQATMPSFNHS
jgi:hypothetical protein